MIQKDLLSVISLFLLLIFPGCSHLENQTINNEQLIERGIYHYRQNYWDEAIADFNKVLKREPKNSTAHFQIGVICHKKGQFDEAINRYKKALMTDPFYSKAYFNLAVIYYENKNDVEKALDYFEKYLKLVPNSKLRLKIEKLTKSQRKGKIDKDIKDSFEKEVK
ncbi:MAG: tetratricopeptide repeat protein [Thermodesulfobacteriota bacterium]|nr:tetratricopeptide repeat protein [Thermodesulfobacteriota bacterium]